MITKFINQLERRFGDWAIPNLTLWIVIFNVIGYILINVNPGIESALLLDANLVKKGELWRLFSYLFIPPSLHPVWIIFALFLTYTIGQGLEQEWGAFRLNLYYLIGMIGTTLVAFFFSLEGIDNRYLNTSLLFAFATIYPNFEILLFFILPVKMKWLGWIAAAFLILGFVLGSIGTKFAILISVANYFLFFGEMIIERIKLNRQVARSRARFKQEEPTQIEAFHTCAVCHKTDVSHPEMHFRVAQNGNEYCLDHLPAKGIVAGKQSVN